MAVGRVVKKRWNSSLQDMTYEGFTVNFTICIGYKQYTAINVGCR